MKIKSTFGRIVGKIENDFNPDNSDWIPRCAAWTIDCMAQNNIAILVPVTKELVVIDRIATDGSQLDYTTLRVYDENNNEIPKLNKRGYESINNRVSIGITEPVSKRVVVTEVNPIAGHNYVIEGDKISINFDCDKIKVETLEVDTYYDEYFNCNVPYIIDDGNLIETIAWYCMMKMLHRGYKHQVFSLTGQEPINPYLQYNIYRHKAKASVSIKMQGRITNNGWANFFYNATFRPRD